MDEKFEDDIRAIMFRAESLRQEISELQNDKDKMESIGYSDGNRWRIPRHWNAAMNGTLKQAVCEILDKRIEYLQDEYDRLEIPTWKQRSFRHGHG